MFVSLHKLVTWLFLRNLLLLGDFCIGVLYILLLRHNFYSLSRSVVKSDWLMNKLNDHGLTSRVSIHFDWCSEVVVVGAKVRMPGSFICGVFLILLFVLSTSWIFFILILVLWQNNNNNNNNIIIIIIIITLIILIKVHFSFLTKKGWQRTHKDSKLWWWEGNYIKFT